MNLKYKVISSVRGVDSRNIQTYFIIINIAKDSQWSHLLIKSHKIIHIVITFLIILSQIFHIYLIMIVNEKDIWETNTRLFANYIKGYFWFGPFLLFGLIFPNLISNSTFFYLFIFTIINNVDSRDLLLISIKSYFIYVCFNLSYISIVLIDINKWFSFGQNNEII